MKRNFCFAAAIVAALLVLGFFALPTYVASRGNAVLTTEPYALNADARRRHRDLVVADLHADALLWNRDLLERGDYGHVDLPRLREGNVALQVFSTVTKVPRGWVREDDPDDNADWIGLLAVAQRWPMRTWLSPFERARHQAARLQDTATRSGDRLRILRTREDLQALLVARRRGEDVTGGVLATEGSHALEGRLENIAALHDDGFRMMGLQHFFDNRLGGSLSGESGAGLTPFGRAAVLEMQRLGIVIDVAHSSPAVVEDVLAIGEDPVVVSHTGIYGACPSARNLSDEQMQRIAEHGGLVGIGFWEGAVCDASPAGVVRAIRLAIDLLGEDHVALGSDFDGSIRTHFDAAQLAILTQEMMNQGFSDSEIEKVMGGNLVALLGRGLPSAGSPAQTGGNGP
ncbi:MAG: dipeptidase [Myxococcota bacterium]